MKAETTNIRLGDLDMKTYCEAIGGSLEDQIIQSLTCVKGSNQFLNVKLPQPVDAHVKKSLGHINDLTNKVTIRCRAMQNVLVLEPEDIIPLVPFHPAYDPDLKIINSTHPIIALCSSSDRDAQQDLIKQFTVRMIKYEIPYITLGNLDPVELGKILADTTEKAKMPLSHHVTELQGSVDQLTGILNLEKGTEAEMYVDRLIRCTKTLACQLTRFQQLVRLEPNDEVTLDHRYSPKNMFRLDSLPTSQACAQVTT